VSMFVFAAISLIAATLLLLLRPWQRQRAEHDATAREINTRIYRDQLAELDRDLAAGTLAAADHAQASAELQRRLLDDTAFADTVAVQSQRSRRTSMLLAVALPIAATGLYAWHGVPAGLSPQAATTQAAAGEHAVTSEEIEQMVAGLAARLEKKPADPRGWSMLARSYRAMGQLDKAQAAFARIGETLNQDPVLLVEYADTMAARADGSLEGEPLKLVMTALKLDPENPMGLSLAATAAYKRSDFREAARYWQQLLQQVPADSDDAQWLRKMLAEIGAPQAPVAATASIGSVAAAGGASVSGSVSLAPALRDSVRPTDTVFVFARSAEGAPMPLAVQRALVSDLPLKFTLDDSLALGPQAKLSSASKVRIEARISRSGSATPASGDLFGTGPTVKPGATQVALQIDQVRP